MVTWYIVNDISNNITNVKSMYSPDGVDYLSTGSDLSGVYISRDSANNWKD